MMSIVIVLYLSAFVVTSYQEFPICAEPGDQYFPSVVPGENGMIVVWLDGRKGLPTIFAQKVDREGKPLWEKNGLRLRRSSGRQFAPQAISDGSGGAIVVWAELQSGDRNIYAQHISGDGRLLWGEDGRPICTERGFQDNPVLISDGSGGAIAVWEDWRNGNQDIYAQRISHDGRLIWAENCVPICQSPGDQYDPWPTADDNGGMFVAWWDTSQGRWDIRAQRVSEDGGRMWGDDGVRVCTANGNRGEPRAISDGSGGVFIVWVDYREDDGTLRNGDIYAQHLDPQGKPLWSADGMAICALYGNQQLPMGISDGEGGIIVTWWDERDIYADIYAQRLDGEGNALWEENGKPICLAEGVQKGVKIIPDSSGGAVIFWRDFREDYEFQPGDFIFAQWVSRDGGIKAEVNGIPISTSPGTKLSPSAASDGKGRFLFVWSAKSGDDSDVFGRWISMGSE